MEINTASKISLKRRVAPQNAGVLAKVEVLHSPDRVYPGFDKVATICNAGTETCEN